MLDLQGVYVFYLQLLTDMLHLCVYLVFFVIVFTNYGLPLHLVSSLNFPASHVVAQPSPDASSKHIRHLTHGHMLISLLPPVPLITTYLFYLQFATLMAG